MATGDGERERARGHFDRNAAWWGDVYGDDSLEGEVYRERERQGLAWIDELALPTGARVMEIGCGAGRVAVALADRGFDVEAVDASPEMVGRAREHIAARGLDDRARVEVADAEHVPGDTGAFDLVVAVGLLPWVPSPERAVLEAARLVRPGGAMLLTADNAARLGAFGEPGAHPLLAGAREARRSWRRRRGVQMGPRWRMLFTRQVDGMIAAAGLRIERRTTVGYGPFTVRGRAVLSEARGRRVHRALTAASRQRLPFLRRMGWHYLVLARSAQPGTGEQGGDK